MKMARSIDSLLVKNPSRAAIIDYGFDEFSYKINHRKIPTRDQFYKLHMRYIDLFKDEKNKDILHNFVVNNESIKFIKFLGEKDFYWVCSSWMYLFRE